MKLLSQILEFLFITVIVKAIIVHWLAIQISKYSENWFKQNERHMAIWLHYKMQAKGVGHEARHVLECLEGKCSTL